MNTSMLILEALPVTLPWGFVALLLFVVLQRVFFHPLARTPGPFVAKLSGFYMIFKAVRGKNTFTRHNLHQKYGQVVRVGPNELSFSDMASIKEIYGQTSKPCLKALTFYRGFTLTGAESVFSTTDRTVHGRMRSLLSHGFSQRGVLQFEAEFGRHIERYIGRIESSASQPVELFDLTHCLFLDITSQLGFAKSFDTLSGLPSTGADDIETYFQISPVFGIFPIARYLPFGIFSAARKAQPRIIRAVRSWIEDFRQNANLEGANPAFLPQMMKSKNEATEQGLSNDELVENAVLFVTAGSSTSASAVLYLLYEVGKRPALQRQLEEEIRGAFPSEDQPPNYNAASTLVSLPWYFTPLLLLTAFESLAITQLRSARNLALAWAVELCGAASLSG